MQNLRAANPYKSYRQIATQTAPPGQLVLMLFDGALKSLDLALAGFQLDDFAERNLAVHNNLQRATDIIRELNGSLDLQAGGELAVTLRNLYHFFETRLNESNRKKSPVGVREIQPMLKELRDAWQTMLKRDTAEPSDSQPIHTARFAVP
jgi:flagellar secretion chaperone FliS